MTSSQTQYRAAAVCTGRPSRPHTRPWRLQIVGWSLVLAGLLLTPAPRNAVAATAGQTCGGVAGPACDAGLWCETRAGACSVADAQGTCGKVPEVCMQLYQPVCGCDGKTYGNDCERRAKKITKKADGACR